MYPTKGPSELGVYSADTGLVLVANDVPSA